jgi:hypothetical protein
LLGRLAAEARAAPGGGHDGPDHGAPPSPVSADAGAVVVEASTGSTTR